MTFAGLLGLLFAVACAVAILNFNWTSTAETPAEYVNGIAFGLSTLVVLVIAHQHPLRSVARVFWWVVALGLLTLAANETFDLLARVDRAWANDDYVDLLTLCVTPFGLYLACAIEFVPPISIRAMKCGFAFQCISALFDLGDGRLYGVQLFNYSLVETLAELSQLIFIETYLFGLGCLLLSIVARGLESPRTVTASERI